VADRQLRTLVKKIPASLAAALLAGILFKIGSEIFVAAQHRTALVLGMFFTYLVVKRLSPRYAVLATLLVGTALSGSCSACWTSAASSLEVACRCGPRRSSLWARPSASASRCSWSR
jgi:predicted benzoate:H+ symporter BenE